MRILSFACALLLGISESISTANAASGEMGTGVPANFGMYSQATNIQTNLWSLGNATIPFPAGCAYIVLSPATMGMDAYKVALAAMMTARVTNRRIRFYAHAVRDGGCGADYLEIIE